jgi:hypothetical protein
LAGLVVVLVFCGIAARKSEPAPVTIQRLFPAPVAEVATSKTSPLRTASPTVDARLERLMDRIAADPRSADARAALATLRREASKRRVDAVPARRR